MLLLQIALEDDAQALGHVAHGAEEQGAVDAHQLELGTLRERRVGAELALGLARVGHAHEHPRSRGAVQVHHQRQQDPEQDGEVEGEQQRGGEENNRVSVQ